jgi:hypothetical protein
MDEARNSIDGVQNRMDEVKNSIVFINSCDLLKPTTVSEVFFSTDTELQVIEHWALIIYCIRLVHPSHLHTNSL